MTDSTYHAEKEKLIAERDEARRQLEAEIAERKERLEQHFDELFTALHRQFGFRR